MFKKVLCSDFGYTIIRIRKGHPWCIKINDNVCYSRLHVFINTYKSRLFIISTAKIEFNFCFVFFIHLRLFLPSILSMSNLFYIDLPNAHQQILTHDLDDRKEILQTILSIQALWYRYNFFVQSKDIFYMVYKLYDKLHS